MTQSNDISEQAVSIAQRSKELANEAATLAVSAAEQAQQAALQHSDSFLIGGLTVFILACFVGYYVVWRVTPALHSPLMAITNAISSVIIVGAVIAAGPAQASFSQFLGFLAVVLASINIFGGFIVTRRMLSMFKKKEKSV